MMHAATVVFVAVTLTACSSSSSNSNRSAAPGPKGSSVSSSGNVFNPPTAVGISKKIGCPRPPTEGGAVQDHPGTTGYYCKATGAEADFMLLEIFGSRGAQSAYINSFKTGGDTYLVYGNGWAVFGTDQALIAAAINAGGTEKA
jgi:hypothetical protein